jgi:hypothetical protein
MKGVKTSWHTLSAKYKEIEVTHQELAAKKAECKRTLEAGTWG